MNTGSLCLNGYRITTTKSKITFERKGQQPNLMLNVITEYKQFHGIESVRPFKVNTGERKQWFRFDKKGDNLQVKQGKEFKKAYASDLLSILNGTYTFIGLKGE